MLLITKNIKLGNNKTMVDFRIPGEIKILQIINSVENNDAQIQFLADIWYLINFLIK